jgi:hypothetical protein
MLVKKNRTTELPNNDVDDSMAIMEKPNYRTTDVDDSMAIMEKPNYRTTDVDDSMAIMEKTNYRTTGILNAKFAITVTSSCIRLTNLLVDVVATGVANPRSRCFGKVRLWWGGARISDKQSPCRQVRLWWGGARTSDKQSPCRRAELWNDL